MQVEEDSAGVMSRCLEANEQARGSATSSSQSDSGELVPSSVTPIVRLTAEEKADAKRKYKNKRGRERWKERKEKRKESGNMITATEAESKSDKQVTQHYLEKTLHPLNRPQKVKEIEMRRCLDRLASFSILPDGYRRYGPQVLDLFSQMSYISRNEILQKTEENAKLMASWFPKCSESWKSLKTVTGPQALAAYATDKDKDLFIDISIPGSSKAKLVSLTTYARLDKGVLYELYVRNISSIRRYLPAALEGTLTESAAEDLAEITAKAKVSEIALFVSQPSTLQTLRTKGRTITPEASELQYAWEALGMSSNRVRQISSLYLRALSDAKPFELVIKKGEEDLYILLGAQLENPNDCYSTLFETVQKLQLAYEGLLATVMRNDLDFCYNLMRPHEIGILAAVFLPRMSIQQIIIDGIDPYLRLAQLNLQGLESSIT